MKQISFNSLHGLDFCLLVFNFSLSEFEKILGSNLSQVPYDRPGPTLGKAYEDASGVQFLAECALDYPQKDDSCCFMSILVDNDAIENGDLAMPSVILTEKVEEFLQFAHIPTDRISWSHELIQFVEYELWRSDEYGNQAIVGRCRNKTDAILLQSEYERKGHKQFYWVKSMNSDRKPAV